MNESEGVKEERMETTLHDLKVLLLEALPYVREATPPSCGRCGTPDSACDNDCVGAAMGADLQRRIRNVLRNEPVTP